MPLQSNPDLGIFVEGCDSKERERRINIRRVLHKILQNAYIDDVKGNIGYEVKIGQAKDQRCKGNLIRTWVSLLKAVIAKKESGEFIFAGFE